MSGAPSNSSRVAIFANPYSGHRDNRPLVESLARAIELRGLQPHLIWTIAELEALSADPTLPSHRAIVACGGDGTIHRVINRRLPIPLATFPLGTANLFAGQFGYRRDVYQMAEALAGGRTRAIDLGRIGETCFSVVASAGFDGAVAHALADWRNAGSHLRRVTYLSYPRHILGTIWNYAYPMMEIETDTGFKGRGALVMVFNMPRYGFNFHICDRAIDDDGLLDYVIFQNPGRLALTRYSLNLALRRHLKLKDVHTGRARSIHLSCPGAIPLEQDGEAAGFAPCHFTALPRALNVILPDCKTAKAQ